jgi:hypothetical protein
VAIFYLLYITKEKAVLLDVQPHGSWTMQSLLRILLQTSPEDMERHQVQGVLGHPNYTADEVYGLRKVGLNAPFELEGRLFFSPGHGISTSGHGTRFRLYVDALRHSVKAVKCAIEGNNLPPILMREIAANLSLPARFGLRNESGQLILIEKSRQIDLHYMPPLQ